MKRILLVAAVILAACTALRAENTTRIGGDSRVDYGFYYGWNTGIHNYGMVFFDINAAQSNLRTRVGVGLAERFLKKGKYVGLNPNLSLDLQYLLRIADGPRTPGAPVKSTSVRKPVSAWNSSSPSASVFSYRVTTS